MSHLAGDISRRCAFLNLGGTIGEDYAADGLQRVAGRTLSETAGLPPHWPVLDIFLADSVEMTFAALFNVKAAIADDTESQGFIVCCGTDLLDEISYAASLILPMDRPIVITAAALPYSAPGADGPANLRRAAQLALSRVPPAVYVVMGDMIFAADGLVKLEPQAVQPFGARDGVIGRFRAELGTLTRTQGTEDGFHALAAKDCTAKVGILTEYLGGADFADPMALDGLVVAAAGAGGLSARTRVRLRRDFLPVMPVVLSTRCPFGFTVNPGVAKHALQSARDDGFTVDGYTHLNALQARIRLILDIGRTQRSKT